ncbi:hypothetical protein AB0C11_40495 [Streptomyces sp. NPDC039016]|uniref:hypothetical protein n=1 Tax=Streptomyces sp. NPDC039016 TaxID=3154330 RepID=UPI0033ECBC1E
MTSHVWPMARAASFLHTVPTQQEARYSAPRHHRGHRPVDATPLQRRLSEICARAEEILGINIEELDLAGQPSPAKAAVGLPVARAGRTAAAREAARHSPATPGGRPPMDIQNANYTPFGIS